MILSLKNQDRRKLLYICAVAVLVFGLVCSALVYTASVCCPNSVRAYESGEGAYLPSPDNSKQYLRELQLYGGTANVLAYELRTWFDGLWHGKSLAYTLIFITVLVSSGLFYAARLAPSGAGANGEREERGR